VFVHRVTSTQRASDYTMQYSTNANVKCSHFLLTVANIQVESEAFHKQTTTHTHTHIHVQSLAQQTACVTVDISHTTELVAVDCSTLKTNAQVVNNIRTRPMKHNVQYIRTSQHAV